MSANRSFRERRKPLGASFLIGAITLSIASQCYGQRKPDPPAPPWREFIKTEGHANEIPTQWIATSEGKFAHSIKLPDPLLETVPFDFAAARRKALWPKNRSVARQYWEHLCATEAGSFILRPLDNVDGFFFLRPVYGASEQANNDRWKLEAPGLEASFGFKYDPQRRAMAFVSPPWHTYQWVDFRDVDPRSVLHMYGFVDGAKPMTIERQVESNARHAVVWRGIRRHRDREHSISGAEWIAFDRPTGEVLGLFRDFYLTGSVTDRPDGIYWLTSARCPFAKKRYGMSGELNVSSFWIPEVLRPSQYPQALKAALELLATDGYDVEDVSLKKPFDYKASKGALTLCVEVKGSTARAAEILLTANEVRHQREVFPNSALIVVSEIELDRKSEPPKATGGVSRWIHPWEIDDEALCPLSFSCKVPS